MSFSQHLVLWVHVAFVIFTIGPVTLAIMSTPRYIRQRDVRIVRYLSRITFVFMIGSLGVLIAGFGLASMLHDESKPWIIVSGTLFLVAVVLLALIVRDQRKAVRALEEGAASQAMALATIPADGQDAGIADDQPFEAGAGPAGVGTAGAGTAGAGTAGAASAGTAAAGASHLASVERGRIAMIGGVVSLIWLVILVLMVWNS
jgi:Ca2+/Na+ antiporter